MSLPDALAGTPAWVVGGTIRDELLGRPTKDVDVAVAGDPEPPARALAAKVRGPVFALSEEFGAWRVIDRRADLVYDFSPLQGETIEEDLARRDFSVNALARPVGPGFALPAAAPREATAPPPDVVDPTGGLPDLTAGVLRVLGERAYDEDPLRALRLVRLAAELGFAPDADTERLTLDAAPRVRETSAERIFAELRRLLIADGALAGLALADRLGLVRSVLPELADLHGVEQSQFHHLDVYDHTVEVLARQIELEGRLEELFGDEVAARLRAVLDEPLANELTHGQALRLGALVHDIGKPRTRGVRADGRVTFIGHDARGEEMVHAICPRLRTSERLGRFLGSLTRHHLVLGFLVHERPLAPRTVYRYLDRTSPVEVEVTLLSCADRLATRGKNADAAIAAHLDLARELMAAALDWRASGPPRPPLRGDDLARELGIEPGPSLGSLLEELKAAVYAGDVRTRDEAIEHARRLRHDSTP